MNVNNPIEILEQGIREVEGYYKECLDRKEGSFAVQELRRCGRDYMQHVLDLLKKTNEDEIPLKRYEVWLSLEEWEGENKVSDLHTVQIGSMYKELDAKWVFEAIDGLVFAIKPHLEAVVDFQD